MIKVSRDIIQAIIKNQEKIYGGAISPGWDIETQVKENYSEKVARENWQAIKKAIPVNKKMKILDLGCGYGFLVTYLRKEGLQAFGCDVDKSSITIARKLLTINELDQKIIKKNLDRHLPYPKESFDLINLNYVLVYAKDVPALFKEIKRVLKKDGCVYLITPNYQCCYDVNYGLFLIPWLPKWLNKLYLRLMGRKNLWFFETFNVTTNGSLEKVFRENDFQVENIGLQLWLRSLAKPVFTGRSQIYKKIIATMRKFHLKFVFIFLAQLGFYTPLIYVLKKDD